MGEMDKVVAMHGKPMDADRAAAEAYVNQIMSIPIPQFFFTSLATITTATDIVAVMSINDRPLAMLMMSPGMAKTVAESLMARVEEYESAAGHDVKSAFDIMTSSGGA